MTAGAWVLVFLFVIMLGLVLSVIFQRDTEPVKVRRPESAGRKETVQKPEEPELDLPQDIREMIEDGDNSADDQKTEPIFPDDPYEDIPQEQAEPEPSVTSALSGMDDEDFSSLFTDSDDDFDQDLIDQLFAEEEPEFDLTMDEEGSPVPDLSGQTIQTGMSPAEIVQKGIRIAWPASDAMMSSKIFGDAILYEWEEKPKSDKVILFDLCEKGLAYPFLEAVRKISDAYRKPSVRAACLIHTGTKKSTKSRDEAAAYLREKERKPVCLISDSAGVSYEDKNLERYGFLTVGSRPSLILKCEANADVMRQLVENSVRHYKMEDLNETAKEAFARMKNDLPMSCRGGLKGGARSEKAVKKIAQVIPETAEWSLPSAKVSSDPDGSLIRLSAPDQQALEDALAVLREEARFNGYALRAVSGQRGSTAVSVEEESFRLLEQALKDVAGYETVLPVLSDEPYSAKGIQSIGIPVEKLTRRQIYALLDRLLNN